MAVTGNDIEGLRASVQHPKTARPATGSTPPLEVAQITLNTETTADEADATLKTAPGATLDTKPGKRFGARLLATLNGVSRALDRTVFSSLTRRIVVLNLAALVALITGILFLNQWRAGLIDARVQSLRVQGEIISAAIAASATVDSDVISVNPDRLLEFQADGPFSPLSFFDPTLEFPISPERVAPLLRNLVTPTRTRARIYDRDGLLILDSASIYVAGEVIAHRKTEANAPNFLQVSWNRFLTWVPGEEFPIYQEYDDSEGTRYPEVRAALTGAPADIVRVDQEAKLLISVAVPIQRSRATVGALLLSTQSGEIDAIIASERVNVLRLGLIAVTVTIVLSLFLARTIAGPMRRLSAAAEKVQSSKLTRAEIPDFTDRPDEIGHLSGALRSMTEALFDRIEDIERFAADVAHELKNPLTSLRSAVETLPLTKNQSDRDRLAAIILHDVQRLDRLISDISNASRLDAELARDSSECVQIADVTQAMISMHEDNANTRDISIVFDNRGDFPPLVQGQDSRLAQVLSNLIDNAISFSPPRGKVTVAIETGISDVSVFIMDEGEGIRGEVGQIFERFYTDRPMAENFGNHSGLGLSISRQIILAHDGTINAQNRADRSGAIFSFTLPRMIVVKPVRK